ncbi:MAG TPA: ArgE/DapE family deacylase [Nocardioidaceae bacterium]|nr:ArgE/DapE family deacylase [Nocardioidaceae bacterium]
MTSHGRTDLESFVLDHLDEDALVDDLAELVRLPSVAGSEAEVEVQELCAELLRSEAAAVDQWEIDLAELQEDPWFPGSEAHRDRAIGVVGATSGDGVPALVLQGHLDVVPPGDPETWGGADPFSAVIRDGALHGRGSCDMKAGVAANLAVVRTLRAAGVHLERPLAVHCVVGEEDGGLGAFATLRRGHRAEAAVITEPTGARIVTATAGALTFRIEVGGRSAHGSMRREGVSAFEAFLPIYEALSNLEQERNKEPDPLFGSDLPYALSVGVVSAGDWASNVPDKLVAEGRLGVQLDEDPRQARIALEDAVAAVSANDPWLRANRPLVTWPGGQFASGRTDSDHPLVDEVVSAVQDTGGPTPELGAEVYGSDLRLYAGIGGIPTLHYGPGDIRVAHGPQEHVNLEELAQVTRALVVLALRRCGVRD